ncbi:protein of unknown function [Kyrpidia spormannii]|uniref:Uncharacterized protein n=1 Tax=Kyrpidia spormannii TaxID=2055160 RepID=A0A6F9ECJ1_9BACL|nr:protein of unknown function [Kyrpidia spormannii]
MNWTYLLDKIRQHLQKVGDYITRYYGAEEKFPNYINDYCSF